MTTRTSVEAFGMQVLGNQVNIGLLAPCNGPQCLLQRLSQRAPGESGPRPVPLGSAAAAKPARRNNGEFHLEVGAQMAREKDLQSEFGTSRWFSLVKKVCNC